MEYRNLLYFVRIAQEKNYSKASESLVVSQSALTRSVQSLERELSVTLINRSTHSFQLTDAGELLYKEGIKIVNAFDKLEQQMRHLSEKEVVTLFLGVPTVLNTLLASTLMEFRNQNFHKLDLQMVTEGSLLLSEKVLGERLDVSLIMKAQDDNRFDVYPIIMDRLVVVVPPDHPLSSVNMEISVSDLRKETFVLLDESFQIHASFMAMCKEAGFRPKIASKSSSWDYLAELVSVGAGITVFPRPILPIFGRNLKGIPIRGNHGLWEIVAITKKEKEVSDEILRLIRFLQDNYRTVL